MGAGTGIIDEIVTVAGRIAKAGWGENANIVRNFKNLPEMLPDQAIRTDLRNAARTVVNDARSFNGLSEVEAGKLDEALKAAKDLSGEKRLMKEMEAYTAAADKVHLKSDESGVYKAAIDKYNAKKAAFDAMSPEGSVMFDDVKRFTQSQAEKYFEREGKGIGSLNMGKAIIGNSELRANAITAYAGIAVGGRLASGGSLTTNNRGERDIAGVPFF